MSIAAAIDGACRCVKCGQPYGPCMAAGKCWGKCSCGWTAEAGKPCRRQAPDCSTVQKYGAPPPAPRPRRRTT